MHSYHHINFPSFFIWWKRLVCAPFSGDGAADAARGKLYSSSFDSGRWLWIFFLFVAALFHTLYGGCEWMCPYVGENLLNMLVSCYVDPNIQSKQRINHCSFVKRTQTMLAYKLAVISTHTAHGAGARCHILQAEINFHCILSYFDGFVLFLGMEI